MNATVVSFIRTYAPIAAGAIVAWLASVGLDVGKEAEVGVTVFLTAVTIAAYYLVARLLEKRWPILGRILLGSSRQPEYTEPQAGGGR